VHVLLLPVLLLSLLPPLLLCVEHKKAEVTGAP
jgi:hypothetical protein